MLLTVRPSVTRAPPTALIVDFSVINCNFFVVEFGYVKKSPMENQAHQRNHYTKVSHVFKFPS